MNSLSNGIAWKSFVVDRSDLVLSLAPAPKPEPFECNSFFIDPGNLLADPALPDQGPIAATGPFTMCQGFIHHVTHPLMGVFTPTLPKRTDLSRGLIRP